MSSYSISNLFEVSGKIVVITGGGTGIGRSIAQGFATNGARVYITGRRMEVLEEAAKGIMDGMTEKEGNGIVIAIQGDVSTKEGCKAMMQKITEKEDRVSGGLVYPVRLFTLKIP